MKKEVHIHIYIDDEEAAKASSSTIRYLMTSD